MPYISAKDDRREKLRAGEPALLAGELNYQIFYYVKHNKVINKSDITQFVEAFLRPQVNYQRYNDLTGCLIRCAFEIERRLKLSEPTQILLDIMLSYNDEINNYENLKCEQNGDVD
jgi:hypothetical protein